jgi:hypothetical protein
VLDEERRLWDEWMMSQKEQLEAQEALQQQRREEALEAKRRTEEERQWWTLHLLLSRLDRDDPVYQALLNTWSNIVLIAKFMGIEALKHFGKVLTAEENNRLTHALTGNGRTTKEYGSRIAPYGPYTPQGSTRQRFVTRSWAQVRSEAVPVGEMADRVMKEYLGQGLKIGPPRGKKQEVTIKKPKHLGE